jgi:hypothetical protein
VPDPARQNQVGRISLQAPPCTDGAKDDPSPNPCSTTLKDVIDVPDYSMVQAMCDADAATPALDPPTATRREVRDAPAIRFHTGGMTFEIVDMTYRGDAVCRGDRQGNLTDVPLLTPGYQISFRVSAGQSPMAVTSTEPPIVFPVNIVRAPDQSVWLIDEGKIGGIGQHKGGAFRYQLANGNSLAFE